MAGKLKKLGAATQEVDISQCRDEMTDFFRDSYQAMQSALLSEK
jgi:hypothetical protein